MIASALHYCLLVERTRRCFPPFVCSALLVQRWSYTTHAVSVRRELIRSSDRFIDSLYLRRILQAAPDSIFPSISRLPRNHDNHDRRYRAMARGRDIANASRGKSEEVSTGRAYNTGAKLRASNEPWHLHLYNKWT